MQWRKVANDRMVPPTKSEATPIVYVVDDDISVREALEALIEFSGWRAMVFPTAREFLCHSRPDTPSCLILDVSLPDLSGLELQQQLKSDRSELPIVFITGYGDIPTSVRAMKAGAVEFLTKPFGDEALVETIRSAIQGSAAALSREAELRALRQREALLSRREREVMALVTTGLMNKQVAGELGISEITVKAHRGKMMRKLGAVSLVELVSIAGKLGVLGGG
jgi:FixJ family two-component response regulator